MEDNKNMSYWDKKQGKTILAIGTIFSFLFGIFGTFMYFKKDVPNLEFIIESESYLFNTEEQLPQIKVMVDSVDILSNNGNISVYSVKIMNNGTKNISLYDYDSSEIGIKIYGGRIIDTPTLLEASSDYLADKIKSELVLSSDSVIVMPHTILNVGDGYLLHFCVLHSRNNVPKFEAFGQIVGQKRIRIVSSNNNNQSNWCKAINGSFVVQLLRLFFYGLSMLLLIFVVAALFHWLSILLKRFAKKMFLLKLKQKNSNNYIVINDFKKNGYTNIEKAYIIRDLDSNRLTRLYKEAQECKAFTDNESEENRHYKICQERIRIYNNLAKIGYLFISDDSSVRFNIDLKEAVAALYKYMLKEERENLGLGYFIQPDEVMLGECTEAPKYT